MTRLRQMASPGQARILGLLMLALPLGGCEWQTLKSSVAGSCAVFERPPYAVRGKTPYDQNVADVFVESGVAGCNWQRPSPRPPALDAPRRKAVPVAAAKRGLVARVKDRAKSIWPPPSAVPSAPLPQPEPVVAEQPPPKPRSAIDDLLDPAPRVRK